MTIQPKAVLLVVAVASTALAAPQHASTASLKPLVNLAPLLGKPFSAWQSALGKPTGKENTDDGKILYDFKAPVGLKSLYVAVANGKVVSAGVCFNPIPKFDAKVLDDWRWGVRQVGLWTSKVKAGKASNPDHTHGDLNNIKVMGVPHTEWVEFWNSVSDETRGFNISFTKN